MSLLYDNAETALSLTSFPVYQVVLRACDSGSPQRCINTTVTINVDRTTEPPRFTQTTYRESIDETKPVNDLVIQVMATDPNITVSLIGHSYLVSVFL